ncbi:serine hydrolase domain-containing protein [Streptomyces sp. NPDC046237]|uniref:serine hydrolase domain-containing protein n=1 Tax=Streptomyces sp. NPDC046237 TaxID=3154914 RepID=UPI0033FA3768
MTRTPSPTRPRARAGVRRAALLCAALLAVTVQTTAVAPALAEGPGGPGGRDCVRTERPLGGQAREVLDIARKAKTDLKLNSVELRVTVDGREVVTDALGESMTGVPARPDMHFRAGSVAFAHIGTALLQLVEEGEVRLDDTVERWLPANTPDGNTAEDVAELIAAELAPGTPLTIS